MARNQEIVKRRHNVAPTAAAGSEQDLARVKLEMDPSNTPVTNKMIDTQSAQFAQSSSTPQRSTEAALTSTPQVLQRPFAVLIRRLTQDEISVHTRKAVSSISKTSYVKSTITPITK